jgi:hypothetical protein
MIIQINYKSGISMKLKCDKFEYTKDENDKIIKIFATGIKPPTPINFGITEMGKLDWVTTSFGLD